MSPQFLFFFFFFLHIDEDPVIQLYVAANLRLIEFSMLGATVFVRALPHSSCSLSVPLKGPSHLVEFFSSKEQSAVYAYAWNLYTHAQTVQNIKISQVSVYMNFIANT